MARRTLTGARFSMNATLLHQGEALPPDENIDMDLYGEWVKTQDPLTNQIIRIWQAYTTPITPDNNEQIEIVGQFPCIARGIVDGGIRVAGTTERFGPEYDNIDYVKLWVDPKLVITKRDRVTNIRDRFGHIQWLDEENEGNPDKATVFNVNGVTPLFNAFNRCTEKYVMLERADI
jgi:hypothetical protein